MEWFDVVDGNGVPTGEVTEREEAHSKGIRHRTAHIWIIRDTRDGVQVLLQKRSENKDSFPGRFDTSSAGHIQAGDEPRESAIRELEEELGITADPADLEFAGTFRIRYELEFHDRIFRDNEIAFVYVYRKPVLAEQLHLQEEEVEKVQWFGLEETYRECLEHNRKFCVPIPGLETLRRFLREGKADHDEKERGDISVKEI